MQRDKVLGLSLAILLIGFAGAFCFRNETSSIFNGPQLQNPRVLDDAIADKEGPKPYTGDLQKPAPQARPTGVTLDGIETEAPFASTDAPAETSARLTSDAGKSNGAWVLPDFLKSKPPEQPGRSLTQSAGAPAQSVSVKEAHSTKGDVWIPKHNQAWETNSAARSNPPQTENARMHRVQPGDTLTGLASRYLGSSARYGEIYEANRDVLQSPNDLRTGMMLRIPVNRSAESNRPASGGGPEARLDNPISIPGAHSTRIRAQSVSTSRQPESAPADFQIPKQERPDVDALGLPAKKFVPVRRSPFAPRSSLSEPTSAKPRSLSQTPPQNLPDLCRFQYFPKGSPGDASQQSKIVVTGVSTEQTKAPRKHTVRRGETLESISLKAYGSRSHTLRIYEANRDRLRSPDGLREGITILLP